MLNSAPETLVKHINIEIISWDLCIKCIENVKSSFISIKFIFISILFYYF
jgi:hypothetical protein